jgi:hypothetical protein
MYALAEFLEGQLQYDKDERMIAGEQTSAHVLTQRLVVVSETTSFKRQRIY